MSQMIKNGFLKVNDSLEDIFLEDELIMAGNIDKESLITDYYDELRDNLLRILKNADEQNNIEHIKEFDSCLRGTVFICRNKYCDCEWLKKYQFKKTIHSPVGDLVYSLYKCFAGDFLYHKEYS